MKKRILKKSDVLREGYNKGLRKAYRVISESLEGEQAGFICPECGNDQFHAHQVCYHDVVVDGYNSVVSDGEIYDVEHPYGTYTCTKCGAEFEELE